MNILEILQRSCDYSGLNRVKYNNSNVPTSFDNISFILFFGDLKSQFILSSFLIKRYLKYKNSNYFILCSWHDTSDLYPDVDEFWTLKDLSHVDLLYKNSFHFMNSHSSVSSIERNLRRFFNEVLIGSDFEKFYKNGFTNDFYKTFHDILYDVPMIPSVSSEIGKKFNKTVNKKIFIFPIKHTKIHREMTKELVIPQDFWVNLVEDIISEGYTPVIYSNYLTYDLSPKVDLSKVININNLNILELLGLMRSCDCCLDCFSNISKFAFLARIPFINITERSSHVFTKDYELDDLCSFNVPYENIYSFADIVISQPKQFMNHIFKKIDVILNKTIRDNLPSTSAQSFPLQIESIRKLTAKKLGTRLFKLERFQ